MTVSFSTLLIVWMCPSFLAVLVDDYYNDSDDYQNQAKKDELADMNDVCNPSDHKDLDYIVNTHGKKEQDMWEPTAKAQRIKDPKDHRKSFMEMHKLSVKPAEERDGSDCKCCFKHPIVIKIGARLAQHFLPHMAQNISDHLDNITKELAKHPDHTADLMAKNMKQGEDEEQRANSLLVSDSFPSIPSIPPCIMDSVGIITSVLSLVVPGIKAMKDSMAKCCFAATKDPEAAEKITEAAGGAIAMFLAYVKGGFAAAKDTYGAWKGAIKVGSLLTGVCSWLLGMVKNVIGSYAGTLSWWVSAFTAVKLLAQIAVWWFSAGTAFVYTVIDALLGLTIAGMNIVSVHQCFGSGSSWAMNYTKFGM